MTMPLFVKLRGAIFHESGYNLNVPPGITKKTCAYFSTLDRNGKVVKLEKIPGCEGDDDPVVNVPLTPYPDTAKARDALLVMCSCLEGAILAHKKEREMLGMAWAMMLGAGLALQYQDRKTQIDALSNLFGAGRVFEAMNKVGGVAKLQPNYVQLVHEALAT